MSLSCQQLVELVTDAFEGRLGWRQRRRYQRHLAACADCTAYVDQLRAIHARTGEVRLHDLSPDGQRALRAAFASWHAA